MHLNLAYKFYLEKIGSKDSDKSILKLFKSRYKQYRVNWLESPKKQYLDHKDQLLYHLQMIFQVYQA